MIYDSLFSAMADCLRGENTGVKLVDLSRRGDESVYKLTQTQCQDLLQRLVLQQSISKNCGKLKSRLFRV